MWHDLLEAIARETGRRAIAPDLAGFGDMPPDLPGRWERQVALVDRFRRELASSFAALMRSLAAGFSDEAIAALDVPVLIPWGANDPFAPVAGAHRFHKELPGAELVVVEGAGHFVYSDAPDRGARGDAVPQSPVRS